jgi:2-polyprenyl-3-methyl-5-hydroxy-6-metoxy-1,4-benzoquinol methylase
MNGKDGLQRLYYWGVLKGGRALTRLMWRIVALRNPQGKRLHPKHSALPEEHHRWYLPLIEPGSNVLDLGADRGGHALPLAEKGCTITCLEVSETAIAEAVKHPNIQFVRADLEKPLALDAESFDAVLALDVLEHLNNRDRFLLEIARVVKSGGKVLLAAPNRETDWNKTARRLGLFTWSDPDHKYEYAKDELIGEIENAGLAVRSVEPVVYDTPWAPWIDFTGALLPGLYRRLWEWKRKKALADPAQSTGFRIMAVKL